MSLLVQSLCMARASLRHVEANIAQMIASGYLGSSELEALFVYRDYLLSEIDELSDRLAA